MEIFPQIQTFPSKMLPTMKSILKYVIVALFATIGLYSCNSDDLQFLTQETDVNHNAEIKQLQATIPDFKNVYETKVQTRTVIDDSDVNNLQLVWNNKDTIGIFPDQGFQVAFPMASGAGTKTAAFDGGGWGLKKTSTYSAYYPLIGQFYLDKTKIPVSLTGQTQDGNGSHAHVGAYDYMVAVNSTISNDRVAFDFNHLVCVLHLSITMPQAGVYTKLLLESNANLITEGTLDLTDGTVTATKSSPVQELILEDVELTAGNLVLDAYVVMKSIDLTDHTLTVKVYDEDGNIYEINSGLGGREFEPGAIYHATRTAYLSEESTGLPRVLINTPNNVGISSKNWLNGDLGNAFSSIVILKPDGTVDYEGTDLDVKGRGNSTWNYPKKPYALKIKSKPTVLGMKEHKSWVLLANWMDRTLMRNDIAFQIAKQTDLSWTPNGKFVELILDGQHKGNYYLCEQIKVDKNRLNIKKMKDSDLSGEAITGGYLMELDTYFDEVNKFHSETKTLPYMFKEPDEETLQPEQLAWFQNYVNTMEGYLYADNWLENREYADYMDTGSFIDWWFVYELSMNWEPNHPKSSYMHKDRSGKLKAGPVWDFDWDTFVPSKQSSFTIKNSIYYGRLFEDPAFKAEVKTRWGSYKSKFDAIPDYIRDVAARIKKSNEVDYVMWPLSANSAGSVNGDQDLSFDYAVERMISAYTAKLNYMDSQITSW